MKVKLLLVLFSLVRCLFALNIQDEELEEEKKGTENAIRETRSTDGQNENADPLKILSFSDDNDDIADGKGEFTSASLQKAKLPESFTICMAFKVDVWTANPFQTRMLTILKDNKEQLMVQWGILHFSALSNYTLYQAKLGPVWLQIEIPAVIFPLQWTRCCLSLDSSVTKTVSLVVDGQLLGTEPYIKEDDKERPMHLDLLLGLFPDAQVEYPGKVTNLNVFSTALSKDRMIQITKPGENECGARGDFLSWEESNWILHSKAKYVELNKQMDGPCRQESKVHVFTTHFQSHQQCMHHCQKIAGGRSPPVMSKADWKNFEKQIDLITPDRSQLPYFLWLSATEGDIADQLRELSHWPEKEVINGTEITLIASEGVWRDYYTGKRLEDWEKPYHVDLKDEKFGESYNCMIFLNQISKLWSRSWGEWICNFDRIGLDKFGSCPCEYPTQPVLKLRGLCKNSFLVHASDLTLFTPKQLPYDPNNLFLLGRYTTRITYNDTNNQWILTDAKYDVSAVSWAPKVSYTIGKHEWTISNDTFECNKGKPYTTLLKLTGCKQEGEFTCSDGQCVNMEERCNQVPDCRDESDEKGCQLITLNGDYNKNIPPIKRGSSGIPVPAYVDISITLMKVVDIDETDHSIHLQFQISLQWRENRAMYKNLKNKTSLNTLNEKDIARIWLPLIIYQNTDQKESTRLGVQWEWLTRVMVTREGGFSRSGSEEVDEAEIFQGAENNITMFQTYTHEFQCQYELQPYPFDTQVNKMQ